MLNEIIVVQCICNKCNRTWIPRDYKTPPKVCPYCKSYDWNKD